MVLLCAALTVPASAADIPRELEQALPREAKDLVDLNAGPDGFPAAAARLAEELMEEGEDILRRRLGGAASILLIAVVCGAAEALAPGEKLVTVAGGLAVTLLSAGRMEALMGQGVQSIHQLSDFSKVLLPTIAAASAVSGSPVTASMQQVTAMFLVTLLTSLISGLLLPMTYLYIAALCSGSCLGESRLTALAEGLKKAITWGLTTSLLLFTSFLSVSRVLSGATDAAAVKMTKAAISAAVPVVGGVISDAAESVLAGAGVVRSTIGVFGVLGVLGLCALPFLHLGIQYLLYKAAAFLCGTMGVPWLSKLIDGLGGAFGLVLGMTGSCAVLVTVSVLCFLGAWV